LYRRRTNGERVELCRARSIQTALKLACAGLHAKRIERTTSRKTPMIPSPSKRLPTVSCRSLFLIALLFVAGNACSQEFPDIVGLVERNGPAVVNVQATVSPQAQAQLP